MSAFDFEQVRQYPVASVLSDIPPELQSGPVVKPILTQNRQQVQVSSSGAQTSGGQAYFLIPVGGASFLKSGSAYLRLTCTVTLGTGASTAKVAFNNATSDANALIQRITISSSGSVLEILNNYGQFCAPHVKLFRTSMLYMAEQSGYMGGSTSDSAGGYKVASYICDANKQVKLNLCIPLLSGLLNGQKDIPLCLLSGPITLLVEYNQNAGQVFYSADGNQSITSWVCDYQALCYESIEVPVEYINALKGQLAQGNVFSMPATTGVCVAIANNASINYLLGLNASSVQAVRYSTQPQTGLNTLATFTADSQILCNVYLDNALINQVGVLDTSKYSSQCLIETLRSFKGITDPTVAMSVCPDYLNGATFHPVVTADASSNFLANVFVQGVSTSRFSEAGLSFSGTRAQYVRLEINKSGNPATTSTVYLFVEYDMLLTVDAQGVISRLI